MVSLKQLTKDNIYGKDEVHDLVQKFCNQVMHKKGLNPSITSDIASVEPSDYQMHLESLEGCTNDLSRKQKK
eukprot:870471-Ditylum_brightwellii.AAC.1